MACVRGSVCGQQLVPPKPRKTIARCALGVVLRVDEIREAHHRWEHDDHFEPGERKGRSIRG